MLLYPDYITPGELTGYVRANLADQPQNQNLLAQWLPNRTIDDLAARFSSGGGGLTDAAEYRTYDAESPIGSRPGVQRKSIELPPISRKIRQGEYDRLRQRANGATEAIRTAILSDAESLTRQIAARVERARADALTNGTITLSENGLVTTIDFGRSGAHSVTAGTLWSDVVNSTPISDLLSWQTTYVATNGVPPGSIVMSTPSWNYLIRNAQVRNLGTLSVATPAIASGATVRDVLTAYDLPPVTIYDAQVKVNGSAVRQIPVNNVLLLPAPGDPGNPEGTDLGGTWWGTTSESLEPEFGVQAGYEAGIVAGVYRDMDPVALWTKAAAIVIPTVANPDLSFRAIVA
jgi:type II secretory pathway pseudopilin PulG